jgi:hypothetical protein
MDGSLILALQAQPAPRAGIKALADPFRRSHIRIMTAQLALFEAPAPATPEGFAYRPALITPEEEAALAARFPSLPFRPYAFRGYLGARRTVSYGWRYADDGRAIIEAQPIPDFLLPVRARAAAFAGLEPDALAQALVIDYPPGATVPPSARWSASRWSPPRPCA